MKLLFAGLVEDSLLSATYESPSYPVSNLKSSFRNKRFQSSHDVDSIMIEFDQISDVSCFFYAYTNASEIVLDLYDDSDGLLHSETIDYPSEDIADSIYFTAVENVAYAIVTITGESIGVYLGKCDLGIAETFPDPLAAWPEPIIDNSTMVESAAGQSAHDRFQPLRKYEWEFADISRTRINELRDLFIAHGIGKPLFIDATNEAHDFITPFFGKFLGMIETNKVTMKYRAKIIVQECR